MEKRFLLIRRVVHTVLRRCGKKGKRGIIVILRPVKAMAVNYGACRKSYPHIDLIFLPRGGLPCEAPVYFHSLKSLCGTGRYPCTSIAKQ